MTRSRLQRSQTPEYLHNLMVVSAAPVTTVTGADRTALVHGETGRHLALHQKPAVFHLVMVYVLPPEKEVGGRYLS